MTTTTIPKRAKRLVNYLESNEGIDVAEFIDSLGNPDLSGARNYAERLRNIHKDYIDLLNIEQKYNKVIMKLLI